MDTGLSQEEAEAAFAPGDTVTLDGGFTMMANDMMLSPCQDDRVGCVAVIAAANQVTLDTVYFLAAKPGENEEKEEGQHE